MTPMTLLSFMQRHGLAQRMTQLKSHCCIRSLYRCGLAVSTVTYTANSAALWALAATSNTHRQTTPSIIRAHNDSAIDADHAFLGVPISPLLSPILTWSFASLLFLGSTAIYLGMIKLSVDPDQVPRANNCCVRCLTFIIFHLIPQGIALYKTIMIAIHLSLLLPDYFFANNNIAYYTIAACFFLPLFSMILLPRTVEATHSDITHIDCYTKIILRCYSRISPWIPAVIASLGLGYLVLKTILNALHLFLPHLALKIINFALFPSLCIILPCYYIGLQNEIYQHLNHAPPSKQLGRWLCCLVQKCLTKLMQSRWCIVLKIATTTFYSEALLLAFYTFFQPLLPPFVLWTTMTLSLISVFWTTYKVFDFANASTPDRDAVVQPEEEDEDEENPAEQTTAKLEKTPVPVNTTSPTTEIEDDTGARHNLSA